MRVQHPHPGVLQVTKSRVKAGFELAVIILVLIVWYAIVLATRDASDDSSALSRLLFYVAPLFALPEIVRRLKVMTVGEVFTLNRVTKLLERDGVRLAHFGDVERVQVRTIHHSEGSDEYRLSVVLKNDEKLPIDQSSDLEEIMAVADDIADVLDVDVVRKDRVRDFSLSLDDT